MGNARRIIATISARFTDLVNQVENHEAVAASALKRFRVQVQEAKVQLKLLEKELDQAKKSKSEATRETEAWKNRATTFAASDKEKALQCVQRYQAAGKEVEFWTQKELELAKHIQDLRRELTRIESQHSELKLEFQKYIAREKTANVMSAAQPLSENGDSLQDIFDRWDRKIIHKETLAETPVVTLDDFANEMKQQEEAQELEAILNELMKQKQ